MRLREKVKIAWSPEFAYAIGLIATDGNLSSRRGQFDFTSKDYQQVEVFRQCLGLSNKIGRKVSGTSSEHSFRVQFSDIQLYEFLLSIGLTPHKSKTIGALRIPEDYFFDFLRGHFDGDGTFYSYWDPRWSSSFMFYTELVSASQNHIIWLQERIKTLAGAEGRVTKSRNNPVYRLKCAKAESLKLLPKLYYDGSVVCLARKRRKAEEALGVIGKRL